MKKNLLTLVSLLLALHATPLRAQPVEPTLPPSHPDIILNNRVLLRFQDKSISVMDLMKKMDMVFYQNFPHLAHSAESRIAFYRINWRAVLTKMIDNLLILADAKERGLKVSDGDIRQEMEEVFGPNVVGTLDQLGLTHKEAWDMIYEDIVVRRMSYIMVRTKAMGRVTPQAVKTAYQAFIEKNSSQPLWKYRVIAIRDDENPDNAKNIAEHCYALLSTQTCSPEELPAQLPENSSKISVSELFHRQENEIAPTHKEVLKALKPQSFSQPVAQTSRASQTAVYRLFYLEEVEQPKVLSLSETQKVIQEELMGQALEEESEAYLARLREHFGMRETEMLAGLPKDFEPFTVR